MPRRPSDAKPDYAVGYGRPPHATQFKLGQSGNPRGRPKGTRSVGAILQKILQRRVPVTEGDKAKRMPALEVMLFRLGNEAMRGDKKAIQLILTLHDRYGVSAETTIRMKDLTAEDRQILQNYLSPHSEAAARQSKPWAQKDSGNDE